MLRVTVVLQGVQGAPYYSNHFFAGSTDGEAAAANAAAAEYWNDMNGIQVNSLTWATTGEVFNLDPATGQTTDVFPVAVIDGAGSSAGEPLPWATQGLMRWRTGIFAGGREIRGRTFLPAAIEADSTNGQPSGAFVNIANTAAQTFVSAATGGGGLVVYSRVHRQAALVSTFSLWNQWASLRTRRS